ncbi:hypothetical protein BDN72DRAFT_521251 [Pluteus cervinus]|uniref:Uncharacterized protein n=1 Tax=Pluteus cervinus TaxID=181527 RepID=A0ACD3AY56_9AGAR|nr:hypothetical protein BDN72DRAFT_521251 [Pluteus cervinus]
MRAYMPLHVYSAWHTIPVLSLHPIKLAVPHPTVDAYDEATGSIQPPHHDAVSYAWNVMLSKALQGVRNNYIRVTTPTGRTGGDYALVVKASWNCGRVHEFARPSRLAEPTLNTSGEVSCVSP